MKRCASLSPSSHTARPKVCGPTVRRAQPLNFFRTHHTTPSLRSSCEPLLPPLTPHLPLDVSCSPLMDLLGVSAHPPLRARFGLEALRASPNLYVLFPCTYVHPLCSRYTATSPHQLSALRYRSTHSSHRQAQHLNGEPKHDSTLSPDK